MTNVKRTEYQRRIVEHSVALPATRRDVADLLSLTDADYERVFGQAPNHDDAYTFEGENDWLTTRFSTVVTGSRKDGTPDV